MAVARTVNCLLIALLLLTVPVTAAGDDEKHFRPEHGVPFEPWIQALVQEDLHLPSRRVVISQRVQTLGPPTEQGPTVSPGPRDLYGCRKVSSCVCETADGSRVDLSPLGNVNNTPRFLDVPDKSGLYSYSWNPCFGFNEGTCQNVGICQIYSAARVQSNSTVANHVPDDKGDVEVTNYDLGHQDTVDYDISSQRGLMMVYTGQGGYSIAIRTSYVQLHCDPTVDAEFTVQGEVQPTPSGIYYFTLRSRYACLTEPTSLSTAPTPPNPVTVTSGPTPDPIYSLKTIVDLLFALTVVAAVGVVLLLLVLTVICVKSSVNRKGRTVKCEASPWMSSVQFAAPIDSTVKDKARLLT